MFTGINYLLVTCFVTITTAIRVDWNTNTGPIIPPTPRTTVRPVPPFREPAPVWEDLSNDIPNPNPYIYVPPPPSRPKQRLNTNVNYSFNNNNNNYGSLITPQNVNSYLQQNNNNNNGNGNNKSPQQVAALAPQYIPNVGIRYVAVVPSPAQATAATKYSAPGANSLSPVGGADGYKLQGKYNAKTKKYKAYEKVKYVPHNYDADSLGAAATQNDRPEGKNLLHWPLATQQAQNNAPLAAVNATTPLPSTASYRLYAKHIYVKDKSKKEKSIKKS